MPFLTEELWHAVYDGKPPAQSIALSRYPQADDAPLDQDAAELMILLQTVIVEVRASAQRGRGGRETPVAIELRVDAGLKSRIESNREIIERMARVSEIRFVERLSEGLSNHHAAEFDVAVDLRTHH